MFSRPSAWLAAGTMALLGLLTWLSATHHIPPEQIDIFKSIQGGVLILFGVMVRDTFHGDNSK